MRIDESAEFQQTTLNINDLASGIYTILYEEVSSKNNVTTLRFIKI